MLVHADLREHRLPDRYTLPLILLGLATNAFAQRGLPVAEIWGAIVGYLVFWLIGWLYHLKRGQEGLGLGDAKLLSAAGAWLGVLALPWIVLLSALGGLGYSLISGRKRTERFAFGPWLAAAMFFLWGLRGITTGQ